MAPILSSASIIDNALTLTFSEALDESSKPGAEAFEVTVNGAERTGGSVAVSESAVTLTLTSAVARGDTVTVGYTVPTGANASPLQDAAGNRVATFSGEAVTNDTPSSVRVGIYSLSRDWSEIATSNFRVYLVRFGDASGELTVNVSVTETGSMLKGTPPSSFTFAAGSDEINLETVRSSLIDDDLIDEPDSEVTITILEGAGYRTSETLWGGPSLTITVQDDDWSPTITTESPVLVRENRTAIKKLGANRRVYASLGHQVSWSLVGGADEDKITLSEGGDLAFKTAKDFEAPDDADTDGDYEVEVRVTDAAGNSTDALLTIRLTDVSNTATGKPAISGAVPQVGQSLTASKGTIDDDDGVPGTFTYQWVRVDGDTESDISGATSSTYTLSTPDVGKQIRVKMSFTDGEGNDEGPLESDPYPSRGSVVAGTRACPSDADWCTEMKVEADVYVTQSGTSNGDYGFSSEGFGSLADTKVSHGGIDYTVEEIIRTLTMTAHFRWDEIGVRVSGGALPDGTMLTVAGTTLTVGANSGASLSAGTDIWDISALSLPAWVQGQEITVSLKFPSVNTDPTGLPAISGTSRVGETLTASASAIADADGLTGATFAWQWIANDGTSDVDIANATNPTYTLTSAEEGKTVKVRVTFTDDGGTEETLLSAATAAVAAALSGDATLSSLSASGVDIGTFAAGTSRYTATVANTVTSTQVTATANDDGASVVIADVTGSTTGTSRTVTLAEGSNTITVTVTAEDGETTETYTVTVTRQAQQATPLTASFSDMPDTHDGATAFTVRISFSEPLKQGGSGVKLARALTVTGATLGAVLRADGQSTDLYKFEVRPTGADTITISLPETTDCTANDAVCTGDGRPLSHSLAETVAYSAPATPPSLSVSDASATEGSAVVFTVSLSRTSSQQVTVAYATSGVTATSGTDFTAASGTLTFAPNETSKTVSVATTDDSDDEDDETFTLRLSSPASATLADATATGTINDNDDAAALTAQFLDVPDTHDGATAFTVRISFSEPLKQGGSGVKLARALTVTGATLGAVLRADGQSTDLYKFEVRPTGADTITISLPETTDCTANDAVCTGDGRPLSHSLKETVHSASSSSTAGDAANGDMEDDGVDEALALVDGVTPDEAAAALLGEGDLSEAQLIALDRLGNGNGRFDLGDVLSWRDRCRRGGARCGGPPADAGPVGATVLLAAARGRRTSGRVGGRRSRGRTPVRCARRRAKYALGVLLAAVTAWSCGDGAVGPVAPAAAVPDPGFLTVEFTAPVALPDIGVLLELEGPGIEAVRALGLEVYESGASGRRQVILAGSLGAGPLMQFRVPDRNRLSLYRVRVIQVTGEDYGLRDAGEYRAVLRY
ncbi:MAG: SwmB domain-containing protein [Gemmatimonadetes bacterium]|nr:SwmB domain-containing protein [Candidatus Palauibacter rhopaloidicola]